MILPTGNSYLGQLVSWPVVRSDLHQINRQSGKVLNRLAYRGFTLIELMISVAILSIALVLILTSFMKSIRAVEFSEDYFKAGLLLGGKLYEIHNIGIEEGISEGVFNEFDGKFSWNLDVKKLEEEDLNEVNLEVLWYQGNKEQDISVETYLSIL